MCWGVANVWVRWHVHGLGGKLHLLDGFHVPQGIDGEVNWVMMLVKNLSNVVQFLVEQIGVGTVENSSAEEGQTTVLFVEGGA